MKIKTDKLTGAQLNWAVASCQPATTALELLDLDIYNGFNPSTKWAQGGPIIERAGMEFSSELCDDSGRYIRCDPEDIYLAKCQIGDAMAPTCAWGPTHLIAAMRCYVAATLGAEVDVPEELA
jgi:hypothetical protein